MDLGYTLLWRKTWKNPVLNERGKIYSKLEAWLYLVNVMANGIDRDGMKRGEFTASIRYLAKSWNWSSTKVHRFISELLKEKMLARVEHFVEHFAEHFIICNYETYNPTRNTLRNTLWNKSNKGIKERINKTSSPAVAVAVDRSPSSESLELSEKLRLAIATRDARSKAARMPDLTHRWASDIDKLLKIDKRTVEECENVIAWCQSPGCFWGPNIQSGKKFREKFDTMYGQMKRDNGKSYRSDTVGESWVEDSELSAEYTEMVRKRAAERKL